MDKLMTAPTREERFAGKGGLNINYKAWSPTGVPRAIVLIVHGVNSHSGYYGWVASQLASDGLAVYAVDLRGRGKSDGERFYVESFADYASDAGALVAIARAAHPGLPLLSRQEGRKSGLPAPFRSS